MKTSSFQTNRAIWRRQPVANRFTGGLAIAVLALAGLFIAPDAIPAGLTGAIFTTNSTCTGVNLNIYDNKDAVYLDGGPAHPGAAGLTDGFYCVQVTTPDGVVLGRSAEAAVQVVGGEFVSGYPLGGPGSILKKPLMAHPATTTRRIWVENTKPG